MSCFMSRVSGDTWFSLLRLSTGLRFGACVQLIKMPYTVFQPLYIYGPHTAKDCEQWFMDRIARYVSVVQDWIHFCSRACAPMVSASMHASQVLRWYNKATALAQETSILATHAKNIISMQMQTI